MATEQNSTLTPGFDDLLRMTIRNSLPEDAVKSILTKPPFLQIPLGLNLRTMTGPEIAPGNVYRSGGLSHLPTSSLALLKSDHNITTIFDLRSRNERERSPTPQIEGVESVWVPSTLDIAAGTLGADSAEVTAKPALHDVTPADFVSNNGIDGYNTLYGNILRTHRDAYKAFFERLRDGEGAILFHCTAGRDRTGVLAALIHGIVESPQDVIGADYALTRIGVEPFRERLLQSLQQQMGRTIDFGSFDEPGLENMYNTKAPIIVAFLESMDGKYGRSEMGNYPGVKGYLAQELGLTADDLSRIKSRLSNERQKI